MHWHLQNQKEIFSAYALGRYDPWFAHAIQHYRLLAYLEYANTQALSESLHAFIYAFNHPATRESLSQLCLGLFGSTSRIIIEATPAKINLTIEVYNENFFFALSDGQFALAQESSLADINITRITYNPFLLLREFIPAGYILEAVTIIPKNSSLNPWVFSLEKT